jgi:hypothetical protein
MSNTLEANRSASGRITPTELAREQRCHVSTIWRWLKTGVIAGSERVRLESTRIGGRVYITEAQFQAFLQRLNEPAEPEQQPVALNSSADAFCEAEGL